MRTNNLPPPVPEAPDPVRGGPGSVAEGLTTRRLAGHTVIALHGDLDIATAPDVRERLIAALRRATAPVIIDLSGVTFCDANGLALLIAARRRARHDGLGLVLAAPRPPMVKLLRITGLHRAFTVHPTLAEARRHRKPATRPATSPTAIG
ncbi:MULTISPECIES: STAS domain-containing protein [Thermomonosporaceae]|uniref:STAS domain-containing protein n=1 Tax=Thermomonosporaceae TaxID=2012 RepID=UPI00255AB83A|nr:MULTISPECIES: STAS domain-containing protein [Thermomonosporaceae]MDL4776516.1 STAS domain-containing protein [Actinomadura xylanilytica]